MKDEFTILKKDSELKVSGFVEIINGDNKIKAKNKFVQSMLQWLINMTSTNQVRLSNQTWSISTSSWNVYLGTDQITTTSFNTTALTTPIGVTPGTAANTQSGLTQNPSNGVYKVVFTSNWIPGAVSGTVGEMGLYLTVKSGLQSFGWYINSNPSSTKPLVSRLAAADGSFTPFTINTANPLTINWTIQYSFS